MEGEEIIGGAFQPGIKAGQKHKTRQAFGSVADEYMEPGIDLNEQLIGNKAATYFFRMKGDAMRDAGIFDGDMLVVDRSMKLAEGKIIVAVLNGELLVRRFYKNFSAAFLIPENNRYKSINLSEFTDFVVWGVVSYVIHAV
jgi:DNA polymerase V